MIRGDAPAADRRPTVTDDRDQSTTDEPIETGGRGVSRRDVLTAAGAALAGGVAMAAGIAEPAAAATNVGAALGNGPAGTVAAEFRGRIQQTGASGEVFTAFGYLTRLAGADMSSLFAGNSPNETTALFTLFSAGQLQSRVLDTNVHALDIVGRLDVYQRSAPGATFADPS